jgi:exosortase A-associated hydrolase 2
MSETSFYFNRNNYQLYGIIHRPEKPNKRAFIFCHPFAEEKLWTHRVYVNYARLLCDAGFTVMRFDYTGHGDSSGSFQDTDVDSRLEDIACAIHTLKENTDNIDAIGLIGLRFGATLAAITAESMPEISCLVLWEPVNDGARYMKEMMRINLTTQTAVYKEVRQNTKQLVEELKNGGIVNIDGYDIKYPMYEQMVAIKLTEKKSRYTGKVLIVQINKNEKMEIKRIEALSKIYQNAECTHVVEQPFWKEIREYYSKATNLFDVTTQWITHNV